jgi:hypothetical protein
MHSGLHNRKSFYITKLKFYALEKQLMITLVLTFQKTIQRKRLIEP